MSSMRRREFIPLIGCAAAWALAARAQQPTMPVIGYLSSLGQAISVRFDAAFRRGLSDVGYAEGQNVSVEYRWDALSAMAADLVQRQANVFRQTAAYADRILKGDDLPISLPTKFELVINLTTAKALDIDVPLSLMLRADELLD